MRPALCETCKWFSIDMEDPKHGIRLSHCSNINGELRHTWYKSLIDCSEYERRDKE